MNTKVIISWTCSPFDAFGSLSVSCFTIYLPFVIQKTAIFKTQFLISSPKSKSNTPLCY